VVFAAGFLGLGLPRYLWIAQYPDSFFDPPPGPMQLFHGFPPGAFFAALNFLLTSAVLCLLTGYRVKAASVALAGLLLVGNGWEYSFGKINHDILLVVVPLLLAAAGWERPLVPDDKAPRPRSRSWPVALLALVIGLVFFSAALPKLFSGWLNPGRQGVRVHLVLNRLQAHDDNLLADLALAWLGPIAWKTLDVFTVVLEAGFLPASLSRRMMRVFCALACVFHTGVYFLMHIFFWPNLLAYAAFVNWSNLVGHRPVLRTAARRWDRLSARVRWYHLVPASIGLGAVYVWVGNPLTLLLAFVPGGPAPLVCLAASAAAVVYLTRAVWNIAKR
jgi:uncharacterized membrane protein YphA (DoxX/SURF4 family)